MRIGLVNQLHGRSGGVSRSPTWESISARLVASEAAGFDPFVFEDEFAASASSIRIGAGGTFGSDYEAFGFPTYERYCRFAEPIEILRAFFGTGAADLGGEFYLDVWPKTTEAVEAMAPVVEQAHRG